MSNEERRTQMIARQLVARGITDRRVLEAMARVPRHRFVRPDLAAEAYADHPVSIGAGQTISQPYMVARMTELCRLEGHERVLEVGAGSGYQSAVLAELAGRVFAVEIIPELGARARRLIHELGYRNVEIECFDGTHGWPQRSPFDAILVAAGAPQVPPLLPAQLADGGRLVIPVGRREDQRLLCVTRNGEEYETQVDTACRFVDLVGRYGWGGPGPAQA
jgi:protein-L-isoaspartate(D-aspartate) O-methyltransferase